MGMFGYLNIVRIQPEIRFYGTPVLDSASYENPYFNNAIYLENPTAVGGRIYLRFQDDGALNAAINQRVAISGRLKTVDVGEGEQVTELEVLRIEPVEP